MHAYYILIIGFLFLLAISLLIVGVSNDAVNFLNSAIGSKAAPFRVIIIIAAVGVLAGAVFSNGMMEVARQGIFNPEHFAFNEIMIIFLAVMLTDVLLLDFFNTLGLPTSTTISIVFGILGAAVAVAVFKISGNPEAARQLGTYINIENSGIIIVGIFLSVVIAFTFGTLIQWIVRLLFSFNLKRSYRIWSGIWGGFAITVILYFLVIKGAKGTTLISGEALDYISTYTGRILLLSFVGWTVIFQLLALFTKVNILKITVLAGTFALAMAFAGNDLVNFIGVPLAGFESYRIFAATGLSDGSGLLMEQLKEPVNTPVYFLVAAGLIMVLTLRYSKKAKSVTATTIDLSRQDEGTERFASSVFARFIVRKSVRLSTAVNRITPPPVARFVEKRFNPENSSEDSKDKLAFDLVRASVNLVVASILIAFGTSMKLPLSTTYVTFMVAMGSSLADGAWGRDSAVYRVTGVLTVIGGWFFTAFSAFLLAFILAAVIYFGKMPAILALITLSVYILIKNQALHRKRNKIKSTEETIVVSASSEVLKSCDKEVQSTVARVARILCQTYTNFSREKHKELKALKKESRDLNREIKEIREDIPGTLKKFEDNDLVSGHYYVQVVTYMKEMCNSLWHVVQPAFEHLDNNHAFDREQTEKLKDFNEKLKDFFSFTSSILKNRDYEKLDHLTNKRDELISLANDILKNRIKILKKTRKGVKISVTYMEMLTETKNVLLNVVQLVKADVRLLTSFRSREELIEEEILD